MEKMYRQGDLLFVETETVPEGAENVPSGVIAEGEITGHTHRIRPGKQAVLQLAAEMMYISSLQGCHVDHQEHHTIDLPAGTFKVQRQREYEPEGWRQVAD